MLPPRKKDAVAGKYQLGLFVRTPDGRVLEWTVNDGTEEMTVALLRAAKLTNDTRETCEPEAST